VLPAGGATSPPGLDCGLLPLPPTLKTPLCRRPVAGEVDDGDDGDEVSSIGATSDVRLRRSIRPAEGRGEAGHAVVGLAFRLPPELKVALTVVLELELDDISATTVAVLLGLTVLAWSSRACWWWSMRRSVWW
jgi:hypothetical protein